MYRAAVIGLGNIGLLYDFEPQRPHPSTHVYAYEHAEDFELVCGIDGDIKKKELLRIASPKSNFYTSLNEAIESGNLSNIDVVSICTPPNTHLDILLTLIKYKIGKVIFCEKPLVKDITEAKYLISIVNKNNVLVIPNISRRWNFGLRNVKDVLESKKLGKLEKINIRYTRGIYNTGTHLFDLIHMWTRKKIVKVMSLGETKTSACPEKSFSFFFEMEDGVTGYAEAIDDANYYLFDIDLYCSNGKIEMRNSGDDIKYYTTTDHHLFNGYKELLLDQNYTGLLNDACMKNAINNIHKVLENTELPNCTLMDAVYPLYIANALEESYRKKTIEEVVI